MTQYALAFILAFFGGILFLDKLVDGVRLFTLPLLDSLDEASYSSWDSAVLTPL